MDVFVLSCVCDNCKLQLIQYNCVKISILPYPVNQTPSSPPACLRVTPFPVLYWLLPRWLTDASTLLGTPSIQYTHYGPTNPILAQTYQKQQTTEMEKICLDQKETILIIAGLTINMCTFLLIVYKTIKSCKK